MKLLCGESGGDSRVVPPVPIPNTEVKLTCADNTCLETDREDRSMPTQRIRLTAGPLPYASLAQQVEHAAVNRRVVGSNPTGGARRKDAATVLVAALFESWAFSSVGQSSRLITGRSRVRVPEAPPKTEYRGIAQLVERRSPKP